MATYPVGAGKTYTTIQAALAAAGAAIDYDAQIPVDAGTYTEALNLKTRAGSSVMPVTVYAADPANRPVIVCPAASYAVIADAWCHPAAGTRVPSFTGIIWSGGSMSTAFVYAANGNPMTFRSCDFLNANKQVFRYPSGGTGTTYRWIIDRCRFDGTGQAIFSTDGASWGLITNSQFRVTNAANMIQCVNGATPNLQWHAYNNSVASYLNGYVVFQLGNVKNNAIKAVSGVPSRLYDCGAAGTYANNCSSVNASTANTGTDGGGNLTLTDPLFADAAIGDYAIGSTSPCYNAGATLADVTVDFAGTARPQGVAYDIGAYELIATATVSTITVLGPTSIRLNLSASVASDATWAVAGNYTITSGTGSAVSVATAEASGNPGSSITLTTSEHTNGATYTVAWAGVANVTSGSTTYTGQGTAPTVLGAGFNGSPSAVRVIFSEQMSNNAALILASNYTITPAVGAASNPLSVVRDSATSVVLTIDRGIGSANGSLSVTGPTDLANNALFGATAEIEAWTVPVETVDASLSSGASFLRLTLMYPAYRDPATWIGANITTSPALTVAYYRTIGTPATAVEFITSGQADGETYDVTWAGLAGINDGSSTFTGAGLPGGYGAISGPVFGSAFGSSGSGSTIDGLLAWDIMPRGVGSELSWERLVFTSLFTDGRIDAGAVVPDGTTDRRGWWADTYTDGTPAASRLWLISGNSGPTARAIEDAIQDALAWCITDGLADAITVRATLENGRSDATIDITAQGQAVTVRVPALWSDYAG